MNTFSLMIDRKADCRFKALVCELGAIQTQRIFESEAADFLWDARTKERYLGQHIDVGLTGDSEEIELSRVAVMSPMAGAWYVAACLVDDCGRVEGLLWKQCFDSHGEAQDAFDSAA